MLWNYQQVKQSHSKCSVVDQVHNESKRQKRQIFWTLCHSHCVRCHPGPRSHTAGLARRRRSIWVRTRRHTRTPAYRDWSACSQGAPEGGYMLAGRGTCKGCAGCSLGKRALNRERSCHYHTITNSIQQNNVPYVGVLVCLGDKCKATRISFS